MHGHQRGRAGGVQRHAGATQIEQVGHPVGDPAQRRADPGPGLDAGQVLHQQLAVVVGVHPHKHGGVAAGQRPGRHPGVLERLPADLEGQPLLGVHQFGLARGDAEELGVESREVVDEGAPRCGVLEHRGVARVAPPVGLPPVGGYLPHRTATFQQEIPEGRGRRDITGQAATNADDGDRFAHRVRGHARYRSSKATVEMSCQSNPKCASGSHARVRVTTICFLSTLPTAVLGSDRMASSTSGLA